MTYANSEARQDLLDGLAGAIDTLGLAIACVGEAHEQLDVDNADKLEAELFKPIQQALGRLRRTYAGFAERHNMATKKFTERNAGLPSQGVAGFLDKAVAAVGKADLTLGELQDSMLPVEHGDAELRAGLTSVREILDGLAQRSRALTRTLGR